MPYPRLAKHWTRVQVALLPVLVCVTTSCAIEQPVTAVLAFANVKARDPQISLSDGRLDVSLHEAGRPVKEGVLPVDSAGARALDALIKGQKGKWRTSAVTYAPSTFIKSKDFTLDIGGGMVVVNCSDSPCTVETRATSEETERVTRAIAESLIPRP
jgi:hypothetical protein